MRFRLSLVVAVLALVAAPAAAFAANPDARSALIDGASEVPAVATTATGSGWVAISPDGTSIAYHVEYSGLSGALVAAHIHTGAPGVAGGVILPLAAGPSPMNGTLTAANFTASGSVTTFAQAVTAIRNGQTYINLHTVAHPAGEVRGNLITTLQARWAVIDGAQEVPAVSTAAVGTGLVVLSADELTISYRVEYSGLSGAVVASHIHVGASGVAGPVILPLVAGPSPMNGTLTAANFTAAGGVTDFAGAVARIKSGGTYFNLHTAAHPGGEVRGQIGAAALAPTPTPSPTSTVRLTAPPTSTGAADPGQPDAGGLGTVLVLLAGAMAVAVAWRKLGAQSSR